MSPTEQSQQCSTGGNDEEVRSPLSPCPQPNSTRDPQLQGMPPPALDGGWGWVIVVCSFYVAVIFLAVVLSFGILFSETLTRMGVSSTTVAWILNVHCFLWNLSTMLVGPLCGHFGWRTVGAVGSLIAAGGFMLLTFATTPLHIFLLFSILIGTVGGAASNVCFLVLSRYFDKRRGLATGIVTTGVAVGQMVVPLLLRAFQDEYGFKGASLLFGAVVLNCCVASLSFHPVERHSHRPDKRWKKGTPQDPLQLSDMERRNGGDHAGRPLNKPHSDKSSDPYVKKNPTSLRISNNVAMGILKTTLGHLKKMKHLKLVMVTLSFAFLLVGYVNFIAQVPFAMQAEGHTPQDSSRCVSVSAIGGTLTRMLVCCFSDRKWFSRKVCYIAGSVLAAVSTIGVVLAMSEVRWIIVCLIFWGVGIGASFSTYHALVIDTCGLGLYESCVSVTGLLLAVLSLLIGPFVGLIRDLSSYNWSMSTCAALQLCCALLWGLEPWANYRAVAKLKGRAEDKQTAVKSVNGGLHC